MAVTISTGSDPESCSSRGSAESVPSRQKDFVEDLAATDQRGAFSTAETKANEAANARYKLLAIAIHFPQMGLI